MLRCDTCPWSKDVFPERVDRNGYPFHICGMTGNIVYTIPRKEKKYSGRGYIHFGISSCGIFDTAEDVLSAMTEAERKRYFQEAAQKKPQQLDNTCH